jgi:hypothetical protein
MLTLIRVDTSSEFVVVYLSLIGFGIGLMLTQASNMIMNSVARNYQGMVSGPIIVERFAPMSMGIALFNLVFIQGAIKVAIHNAITRTAPVNIRIETLIRFRPGISLYVSSRGYHIDPCYRRTTGDTSRLPGGV